MIDTANRRITVTAQVTLVDRCVDTVNYCWYGVLRTCYPVRLKPGHPFLGHHLNK
jgi:hypothetical protein